MYEVLEGSASSAYCSHYNRWQRLIMGTTRKHRIPVTRMTEEELPLGSQCCSDVFLPIDVPLTAIHNTDVACNYRQNMVMDFHDSNKVIIIYQYSSTRWVFYWVDAKEIVDKIVCVQLQFMSISQVAWAVWQCHNGGDSPRLSGRSRFSKISLASVPSSIKSSFVMTPIVRAPMHRNKNNIRFMYKIHYCNREYYSVD